jgi:hypothetical protein
MLVSQVDYVLYLGENVRSWTDLHGLVYVVSIYVFR